MFGLARPKGPVLEGTRVMLRLPLRADHASWSQLRADSRDAIQPYEPLWPEHDLTQGGFSARVRMAAQLAEDGQAFQFLVFERRGAPLLGGVTLGNIRRGAAQTAQLGYWLGTRHEGQGLMSDAVVTALRYSFSSLRLHRVEAASIADNHKSVALLQRCGFRHEGTARSYLEINGRRQDHELFACLATDFLGHLPLPARSGG
ncbi:MAG: GNAT family N-acetyltransferase [Phyllobacteriaceae bacterium]|nr:GNAT family N-acetyltransferase [Phyllobacteriaceae bacterium]